MRLTPITGIALTSLAAAMSILSGCHHHGRGDFASSSTRTPPQGTISDPVWQKQEENAEASDFVIHEHEFRDDTIRLNRAGEEHLKQIAVRVSDTPFPVIVQPSSMSAREGDVHGFPIHGNDELDQRRRELVVRALIAMGVDDAEGRVVIAPALAPGFRGFEAERAYSQGFSGQNSGSSGFGGFTSGAGF